MEVSEAAKQKVVGREREGREWYEKENVKTRTFLMKENHYNQGALSGGSEHFNSAQNFQESFWTLLTTCLCIKTRVPIPQSLTHQGRYLEGFLFPPYRDLLLVATGRSALALKMESLLIRKEMEFEQMAWKASPKLKPEPTGKITQVQRGKAGSKSTLGRTEAFTGMEQEVGLGSETIWDPVYECRDDGSPTHFSESKLGSNHWSRRELLRRWGGREAEDKEQQEGHQNRQVHF